MIISERWLRDWVHVDLNVREIADCLTNAGLEVDGITSLPGLIDKVVVGEVLEVNKHPDADRLKLTKVNIGDEMLDIVCGASNVRQGLFVAVATVGAKLPNGLKIKLAKVRGIESKGMLCSAEELGLEESSSGILELDSDAEVGQRVDEYLQLDDNLIDIDLTPNRGDCLSVQGVARELKVLVNGDYHPLDVPSSATNSADTIDVKLLDSKACPKYLARVISNINTETKTPLWMQERLRRCAVRPISPIVDITNYVMLELGQPMHAFDRAKIDTNIQIRQSVTGETIKLLDGSIITLDSDSLVVADAVSPIALAGVMGGTGSAINNQTTDIVLEAAHFTHKAVAGRARRYGLHTESSHRFERGVDPYLPEVAMQRATELVLTICGGEAGELTIEKDEEQLQSKTLVAIRQQRLQQLLGMEFATQEVSDILGRVAESVDSTSEGWSLLPPSYRFDLKCEADLVEEIARVKGYDNIPTALPRIAPRSTAASEQQVDLRRVRQTLIARDYHEAINYSFIDPELHANFSQEEAVELTNPLAQNMSIMRTSLLPGLIRSLQFNHNRQRDRIRLFEIGASYHKTNNGFHEVQRLAGLVMGSLQPVQWGASKSNEVDFYDLKSDLEAVLSLTCKKELFIFNEFEHIAMHPGQVSMISRSAQNGGEYDRIEVGYIGRLHPSLQKLYGLNLGVFGFELNLDRVLKTNVPTYTEISRFPSVKRDISIVINDAVPVSNLLTTARKKLGAVLNDILVFDIYRGEGVADECKSVSLSLVLQYKDRTMTDDESEKWVKQVIDLFEQEFAAQLRS